MEDSKDYLQSAMDRLMVISRTARMHISRTARITLHYPPLSFRDAWIERELLSQPPLLVVSSSLPPVIARVYTVVLFDANNGYLHWLVVNHSTANATPVVDYSPPDSQLPGRDGLVRLLAVAVLEQNEVFSSEDISEIRDSVRRASPFDFCLVGFSESRRFKLVDLMVVHYTGLAVYNGVNDVSYLAPAEGIVQPLQPLQPLQPEAPSHVYHSSVRWGSFSTAETVYRISRIAQSNSVMPGGRFIITYPDARGRQPLLFSYPTMHVRFSGQSVVDFYNEYVNSLPPHLRPAEAED